MGEPTFADLDRCVHGRHSADNCLSCPDGWSTGNLLLRDGQRIGTNHGGDPIAVGQVRRHARSGDLRSVPSLSEGPEINWDLIQQLAGKPHRHLNIVDGARYGLFIDGGFDGCSRGVDEVMQEARTVQHLLDLIGIPEGAGYAAHIDARVYLAIRRITDLNEQLGRIAGWHARETGPAGTVGDFCTECSSKWPCDTRRMADGTYRDDEDGKAPNG